MHINDLNEATQLSKALNTALKEHNVIEAQLIPNGNGHYNYGAQVRISIGGDSYGNGELAKICIPVSESADAKKKLIKMKSAAWGKVVGLRASLRMLGVSLDEPVTRK